MKDLRVVNAYAVLGNDGVTLVESGWATTMRSASDGGARDA
jgi:hypothetical protein